MIEILDCTLRDGGYVNNWNFSENEINGIVKYLHKGNIDKVELGYLTEKKMESGTLFNSLERIEKLDIPNLKKIIMINYGEFSEEKIPLNKDKLFGIRIVFKKSQWKEALNYSLKLQKKGYQIFLQPMQTAIYEVHELKELIEKVNKIEPYALYIVDSFGEMNNKDMLQIIKVYAENLNHNIKIGFHSHNNLQLSFALSIEFLNIKIAHGKIVDSSVYGMGRGAGNLNTELISEYLNNYYSKSYLIENFLKIMDLYLEKIYQKEKWGYNLGHFISAKLGCHPNYASYLLEKRNLGVEGIKIILKKIPKNEKSLFNKELLEELYIKYHNTLKNDNISNIEELEFQENILIIAPGMSILKNQKKLNEFIEKQNKLTVVALNHKNIFLKLNYLFFSNEKRLEEFSENYKKKEKIIITSNIKNTDLVDYIIDYNIFSKSSREDLSTEIFLNLLEKHKNVKKIYIAGMDGYLKDKQNYYFDALEVKNINEINEKVQFKIKKIKKEVIFLTKSIYEGGKNK